MMKEISGSNLLYSALAAGVYSSVEFYQKKDVHVVETFLIGLAGAYTAQAAGYVFAQCKAKYKTVTPDTFVWEYLIKNPSANVLRISGIVAGIGLLHLLKEN